jgi:hypothetical protein
MSAISTVRKPVWPVHPIDPRTARVSYYVPADEFLVYFGGQSVPKISDPLDAPGFEDVAVMIALGPAGELTDEIVGVQVIPMLLGAVQAQPHWAVLAWAAMAGEYGTELLRERLPAFLNEVAAAFAVHWTPTPADENGGSAPVEAMTKRPPRE